MAKYIKVINHGSGSIDLTNDTAIKAEARPVELHYNTNGSITDEPTFAIVMQLKDDLKIAGQFSLETLRECLDELGYKII